MARLTRVSIESKARIVGIKVRSICPFPNRSRVPSRRQSPFGVFDGHKQSGRERKEKKRKEKRKREREKEKAEVTYIPTQHTNSFNPLRRKQMNSTLVDNASIYSLFDDLFPFNEEITLPLTLIPQSSFSSLSL